MRCSPSLFFRRGSDKGFGFSRLVPSKDAGEAVPLIALVCSGTFIIIVRVLAVSLSLFLSLSLSFVSFFFFRDTLFFFRRENAFFDTTRREVPFPRALERCHQGGGSSFREREREMRLCLCLSPFLCRVFASFLNKKNTFFCRFQSSIAQESSLGRPLCRGKSFIRLDFMPPERKGNAASTSQSKRSE